MSKQLLQRSLDAIVSGRYDTDLIASLRKALKVKSYSIPMSVKAEVVKELDAVTSTAYLEAEKRLSEYFISVGEVVTYREIQQIVKEIKEEL
jgi:hypothetical protein